MNALPFHGFAMRVHSRASSVVRFAVRDPRTIAVDLSHRVEHARSGHVFAHVTCDDERNCAVTLDLQGRDDGREWRSLESRSTVVGAIGDGLAFGDILRFELPKTRRSRMVATMQAAQPTRGEIRLWTSRARLRVSHPSSKWQSMIFRIDASPVLPIEESDWLDVRGFEDVALLVDPSDLAPKEHR